MQIGRRHNWDDINQYNVVWRYNYRKKHYKQLDAELTEKDGNLIVNPRKNKIAKML